MIISKTEHPSENRYPKVHLPRAWLITWMGTEPWAWPDDWRSIMAIISGRRSQKFIEEVLWLLDTRAKHSGYAMAYYANRRREFGLPYRCGPGIRSEGSNAWLYARQVTDLRVIKDDKHETIQWTEPDRIGNHPDTSQLVILSHGRPQSVTRSVDENIGGEPFPELCAPVVMF